MTENVPNLPTYDVHIHIPAFGTQPQANIGGEMSQVVLTDGRSATQERACDDSRRRDIYPLTVNVESHWPSVHVCSSVANANITTKQFNEIQSRADVRATPPEYWQVANSITRLWRPLQLLTRHVWGSRRSFELLPRFRLQLHWFPGCFWRWDITYPTGELATRAS